MNCHRWLANRRNQGLACVIGMLLIPLPVSADGWLDISSVPGNAAVIVDHQQRGATPYEATEFLRLKLIPGLHLVTVRGRTTDGQQVDGEHRVVITKGNTTSLAFDFSTIPATVKTSLSQVGTRSVSTDSKKDELGEDVDVAGEGTPVEQASTGLTSSSSLQANPNPHRSSNRFPVVSPFMRHF